MGITAWKAKTGCVQEKHAMMAMSSIGDRIRSIGVDTLDSADMVGEET